MIVLCKRTFMGLWMQEKMEEDDGWLRLCNKILYISDMQKIIKFVHYVLN